MQRIVILSAVVVIQLCLGGLYAWSAFVPALRAAYGFSAAQTQAVFGATIASLSLGGLVTGPLLDRIGPRPMVVTAGALLGLGYLGAGFFGDRFAMLLLCVGGINGLAIAFGYMSAVSTAIRWFPDRKGLISGVAVAGYGVGAILLASLARALEQHGWGPLPILRAVGCVYGPAVAAAGLVLRRPAQPPGRHAPRRPPRLTVLLGDPRFLVLFVAMFCTTYPGIALIGAIKPIALWRSLPDGMAAAAISALAVGNGSGRILCGLIQDKLGARKTTVLAFAGVAASVAALAVARQTAGFLTASAFVGFCYGGSLGIYPAQSFDAFGADVFGHVYGRIVLAHGLAAMVAPWLAGALVDRTGSYSWVFVVCGAVVLAGGATTTWLMRWTRSALPMPDPSTQHSGR